MSLTDSKVIYLYLHKYLHPFDFLKCRNDGQMIKMLAHSSPIAVVVGGGGQVPGAVVPLPPPAVGDVAGVQALVLNRSDDCMGGLHRSLNCNDDFKHI